MTQFVLSRCQDINVPVMVCWDHVLCVMCFFVFCAEHFWKSNTKIVSLAKFWGPFWAFIQFLALSEKISFFYEKILTIGSKKQKTFFFWFFRGLEAQKTPKKFKGPSVDRKIEKKVWFFSHETAKNDSKSLYFFVLYFTFSAIFRCVRTCVMC